MNAPVAFFIFNRPKLTAKVFEVIRQSRPNKLFIIADGPRPARPGEAEKCAATRAVVEQLDWDCEVFRNYSEVNLGCGQRVSTGITWVFEQVESAIILEDDCLPHPTFFPFCEQLLEKYRNEPKIMSISGTNWLGQWKPEQQSYHFFFCGGFWGWATWRRAWQGYDYEMKLWENKKIREQIQDFIGNEQAFKWYAQIFSQAYRGEIDTWDYQWIFHCFLKSGMEVVPAVNLISNIGFGEAATHTKNPDDVRSNLPQHSMLFPLEEPKELGIDREYGRQVGKKLSINNHLLVRLKNKIKRWLALL
jgi:hypothetical protein